MKPQSLQADANELVAVLWRVIGALESFQHPNGASYGADMARRLRPRIADFERAVVHARSREAAVAILDELRPMMDNVNGATTKGELDIFTDDTLDRYHRLASIFQESRYAGQNL
jgi:hypothetical protein